MPYHHARKSGIGVGFERHEVDRLDACKRAVDNRQRLMRVLLRVSVSGEMLSHRHHSAVLKTARVSHDFVGDVFGILAKRACADYGIQRVAVDVGRWSEIHNYAYFFAFACHFASVFIDEHIVLHGAEHHVFRETRSVGHTHRQAPFAVKGDGNRCRRDAVDVVCEFGVVLSLAAGKVCPSDMVFLYGRFDLVFCRI